jgi:O-antigen/teichoic acid export membrane protein
MEAYMAGIRLLNVHRTWEDYAGIVLGVVIGLSPWLAGEHAHQAAMWNAAAVGALVLALSAFELVELHRSEEAGEIALGLWLIASPFVFGYAESALAIWHFVLGAVVVLLAALELWQDWKLSEKELAQHGQ